MEIKHNKYSNGKIYIIFDNTDETYYYIGSTILSLLRRLQYHKYSHAKEHPEQKVYKHFNSIN